MKRRARWSANNYLARGDIGDTSGNNGSCVSLLSAEEEEEQCDAMQEMEHSQQDETQGTEIDQNHVFEIKKYLNYCWSLPSAVRPHSKSKKEIFKKFGDQMSAAEVDAILKDLHEKGGIFYLEEIVLCIFPNQW